MSSAPIPVRGKLARLRPALLATAGVAAALAAQRAFDARPEAPFDGYALFALGAVLWAMGTWRWARSGVPSTAPTPPAETPWPVRRRRLALGLGLAAVALVVAPALAGDVPLAGALAILRYEGGGGWPWRSNNVLTPLGVLLWAAGTVLVVAAFVQRVMPDAGRLLARRARPAWPALALAAIVAVACAVRFWDLPGLPREMTSDHTEKLLDVYDVLQGARPVFFDENGGREPLQFYLTAALVALGVPYGFIAIKVAMAIVSVLAVPAVYLAGREAGGRALGLAAAAVLAAAPWHVQVARASMRIGFAPLFAALVLWALLRVLRSGARNDWLLLGVTLGAGMYGYTGFRPMAAVVALAVPLKLAHDAWSRRAVGAGFDAPAALRVLREASLAAGVALLVAAPLVRYAVDQPEAFMARTLSRVTDAEVALVNPPLVQLRINAVRALLMVNRTADSAWIHSPPGRPALEAVGGALFVLGLVTAGALIAARRDWRMGLVVLAWPAMLLSSVLALAFPLEVPHLGRAAGALPMVAILAGLPLAVLPELWRAAAGPRPALAATVASVALAVAMVPGAWSRVFGDYRRNYDHSTLNTSDGVAVARQFLATGGDLEHVWLVGWPHGWDHRVLGIALGDPTRSSLLWDDASGGERSAERAEAHAGDPAAKLYLVGGAGAARSVAALQAIFPEGRATHHAGREAGKDFWSVYVPPATEDP